MEIVHFKFDQNSFKVSNFTFVCLNPLSFKLIKKFCQFPLNVVVRCRNFPILKLWGRFAYKITIGKPIELRMIAPTPDNPV